MKSYNERLPMIDELIKEANGEWPHQVMGPDLWIHIEGGLRVFCTRTEFDARAKELGWVNGYKWGVEYTTDGKRPDLPDDVVVDIKSPRWEAFGGVNKPIHIWHWPDAEKFKVTDNRYKPKSTSKSEVDNWHERGELPPVGEVCECYALERWEKCMVMARDGDSLWIKILGESYMAVGKDCEFRPIQSERDKLVERASEIIDESVGGTSEHMAQALYDAGMLTEPK